MKPEKSPQCTTVKYEVVPLIANLTLTYELAMCSIYRHMMDLPRCLLRIDSIRSILYEVHNSIRLKL